MIWPVDENTNETTNTSSCKTETIISSYNTIHGNIKLSRTLLIYAYYSPSPPRYSFLCARFTRTRFSRGREKYALTRAYHWDADCTLNRIVNYSTHCLLSRRSRRNYFSVHTSLFDHQNSWRSLSDLYRYPSNSSCQNHYQSRYTGRSHPHQNESRISHPGIFCKCTQSKSSTLFRGFIYYLCATHRIS